MGQESQDRSGLVGWTVSVPTSLNQHYTVKHFSFTLLSALSRQWYPPKSSSALSSVPPPHYRRLFDAVGYRLRQPMGNMFQLSERCITLSVMTINMNKAMLDCLWWSSHSKKPQDGDSVKKVLKELDRQSLSCTHPPIHTHKHHSLYSFSLNGVF